MCFSSIKTGTQNCNRFLKIMSTDFEDENSTKLCLDYDRDGLISQGEMDIHNGEHIVIHNATTNIEIEDFSNFTFPNELWLLIPADEIIIKLTAFLPMIVWGIFGNALLLFVIIKNKNLHSPTNMLIANMAVADLVNLLLHPWVFLVYDFIQNYQLGEFGCKMEGWMECSVLLTSVMTLCAISYDRLTAIVLPLETRISKSAAKGIVLVTWTAGFILATPLVIFRTFKERQWKNFLEKYCTEDTIVLSIYWHVLLAMLVWLPLAIMLICYVSIFIKLERYEQKVLRRKHIIWVKYKTRAAKMMFIVVVTFVACRTPFTALIFYRHQLQKTKSSSVINQAEGGLKTIWLISKYLSFLNASVNPIIYGLTNEKFRRALKNCPILRCILKDFDTSTDTQPAVKKPQQKQNKNTEKKVSTVLSKLFHKKTYELSESEKETTSQYEDVATIKHLPKMI